MKILQNLKKRVKKKVLIIQTTRNLFKEKSFKQFRNQSFARIFLSKTDFRVQKGFGLCSHLFHTMRAFEKMTLTMILFTDIYICTLPIKYEMMF